MPDDRGPGARGFPATGHRGSRGPGRGAGTGRRGRAAGRRSRRVGVLTGAVLGVLPCLRVVRPAPVGVRRVRRALVLVLIAARVRRLRPAPRRSVRPSPRTAVLRHGGKVSCSGMRRFLLRGGHRLLGGAAVCCAAGQARPAASRPATAHRRREPAVRPRGPERPGLPAASAAARSRRARRPSPSTAWADGGGPSVGQVVVDVAAPAGQREHHAGRREEALRPHPRGVGERGRRR